jgi:hypothetical protein
MSKYRTFVGLFRGFPHCLLVTGYGLCSAAPDDRNHFLAEQGNHLFAPGVRAAPQDAQDVFGTAAATQLNDLFGHLSKRAGDVIVIAREFGAHRRSNEQSRL